MKRWLWLLPALLILARVEHTGTDIGSLDPVELVRVTASEVVWIETDTGRVGSGGNLGEAVANLHGSAPKEVFLETAQFLVLGEGAEKLLPELYDLLRPSCRVCIGQGEMEPAEMAAFLRVHRPKVRLLDLRAGETGPEILSCSEGRGHLAPGIH